jgi:hypothetical protein
MHWIVGIFIVVTMSFADADGMLKTIYCHISEMSDGRCFEKAQQLCPDGFTEISRRYQSTFTGTSNTLELDFVCKKSVQNLDNLPSH